MRGNTGPAAYSTTNTFAYLRDDDRFEQVMAYFWVNQAQEYLQSLGFGRTLRPVNMESQDVRIDQYGIDNSYSWDKHDFLRFGKGGVDDAEDAEVIVHEYGHAVHDAQVPGFGTSEEAGSIGESFGDYLAVSVGLAAATAVRLAGQGRAGLPDGLGRHLVHPTPRTASAASTATSPSPTRRGEVHHDGQIWSQALWEIRQGYPGLGLHDGRLGPHADRQPVRLRARHVLLGRREGDLRQGPRQRGRRGRRAGQGPVRRPRHHLLTAPASSRVGNTPRAERGSCVF